MKMTTDQLSQLVREFNDARDTRLAADRHAAKLKQVEVELKGRVIAAIKDSGLQKVANVKYQSKLRPHAKDWNAIHTYIIENDAWDLMEKRLGVVACNLRWEEGLDLPGIEQFPVDDLSVGKRVD